MKVNRNVYDLVKLGVPYIVKHKVISNTCRTPFKLSFHGKEVIIRENNPSNSDIPSFEHGWVHIYDNKTGDYYGACGILCFARSIGINVD